MKLLCDEKYLVFPASYHACAKRIYFYIGHKLVYDLVVNLDYDEPDHEFYLNVERFRGKEICITSEPDMEIRLRTSDTGVDPKNAYIGKYRPAAHFTARRGWLNDPNGLVYYEGKYFMFYQHNPVACTWENMHWGYAASTDLMHWEEKDIVLYPDEHGTMFSGSAVIDDKNITGLKENRHDVLLLFYTCAGSTSETAKEKPFTQCLAYSTDGGETFRKYEKNPLIDQIAPGNRDPKVFYHEPTDSYIMALYLDNHEFALFSSKNLLDWELLQKFFMSDEIECPDFYPLPVDGDPNHVKWVYIGASDKYYIGDFDGTEFKMETEIKTLNYGNNSYAAQSWSNIAKGRRIRTSFATVVIPGMPFGSCMSIPQEMSLKNVNGELRLCAVPVPEIKALYSDTETVEKVEIGKDGQWSMKTDGKAYDISMELDFSKKASWKFSLLGFSVEYDPESEELKCFGQSVKVKDENHGLKLRLILDTVYTEIFVGSGDRFMGMTYIQDSNLKTLKIETKNDKVLIEKLVLSKLKCFWE